MKLSENRPEEPEQEVIESDEDKGSPIPIDPKELSAYARPRTKGVNRSGDYLNDRSIDYG